MEEDVREQVHSLYAQAVGVSDASAHVTHEAAPAMHGVVVRATKPATVDAAAGPSPDHSGR